MPKMRHHGEARHGESENCDNPTEPIDMPRLANSKSSTLHAIRFAAVSQLSSCFAAAHNGPGAHPEVATRPALVRVS